MNCWYGNASCFTGNFWWVMPVIFFALCVMVCLLSGSRFAGRRFCSWSGRRPDDLEEMKKEIRDLKEEIKKLKEK